MSAVTLVLPWAVLVTDNRRFVGRAGKRRLSSEYRDAKANVATLAMGQIRGPFPALPAGALRLEARAYFPDRRKRDAANYRKLITDALSTIAYADDAQVHDERWIRAGVSALHPRIELTIQPLDAAA